MPLYRLTRYLEPAKGKAVWRSLPITQYETSLLTYAPER